jgi:hypothetical protein
MAAADQYGERVPETISSDLLQEALRQIDGLTAQINKVATALEQVGLPNGASAVRSIGRNMVRGVSGPIVERSIVLTDAYFEENERIAG